MFLFNVFLYLFIIGAEYRRGRVHHQHKKRSVEPFHTAFELFFSIQQLTVQCSVNWNHSLLIIYAYRWFIKFVHVIQVLHFSLSSQTVRPKNAQKHLSVRRYRERCMDMYAK